MGFILPLQSSHWSLGNGATRQRRGIGTYVVTSKVVDVGLGQHGVVLKLRLAERRSVSGDDNELGLSGSKGLEGRFVSERDCRFRSAKGRFRRILLDNRTFTRLHHKRKARVDAVGGLLGLLCRCHRCAFKIVVLVLNVNVVVRSGVDGYEVLWFCFRRKVRNRIGLIGRANAARSFCA